MPPRSVTVALLRGDCNDDDDVPCSDDDRPFTTVARRGASNKRDAEAAAPAKNGAQNDVDDEEEEDGAMVGESAMRLSNDDDGWKQLAQRYIVGWMAGRSTENHNLFIRHARSFTFPFFGKLFPLSLIHISEPTRPL